MSALRTNNPYRELPRSNLNLIYGRSYADMDVLVRGMVPEGLRDISPLMARTEHFLLGRGERVFHDVAKSRTHHGRIDLPETFLHPKRAMTLAAQLFTKAVTKGRSYYLLTHSEHILARVMRLVREGGTGLPKGFYSRTRVTITVAVNDAAGGSMGVPVALTDEGELGSPWPGGFSTDPLLLAEMTKARRVVAGGNIADTIAKPIAPTTDFLTTMLNLPKGVDVFGALRSGESV